MRIKVAPFKSKTGCKFNQLTHQFQKRNEYITFVQGVVKNKNKKIKNNSMDKN